KHFVHIKYVPAFDFIEFNIYDLNIKYINPTSGVLMGVLAASGISYGKWIRFMAPLALIWFIIGLVFLIVGVNIEWGPY
ncbi:hypothetical protein VUV76_18325, partial [Bacillus thuringiensis]|nr:hypothetical protein [Bacillus thuringiensis]